jgi:large subunit ribosomal protein L17
VKHRRQGSSLGRVTAHRRALLRNLAVSLIVDEAIITSRGKADELRRYVEPLITKSKRKSVPTVRALTGELPEPAAVKKLLETIGPKYKDRAGGYVRLSKLGPRPGDGAESVKVELV